MKRIIYLIIVLLSVSNFTKDQWPSTVTMIESKGNDSTILAGDLAKGAIMEDISWAANSTNACFVATQNTKFRGNHVLYATTIPPHSIMTITVTPADTEANMSLYGYMLGATEHRVVPDLPGCITCEADFKWDRPVKNRVQTHERRIEFQNPTKNTYNIVIGVAAPKDVTTGQFNLKVKLRS